MFNLRTFLTAPLREGAATIATGNQGGGLGGAWFKVPRLEPFPIDDDRR